MVPPELAGERIDRVLARLVPEWSRAEVQRLIERGLVRSGDADIRRSSHRMAAGAAISVMVLHEPPRPLAAEPMLLDVRYEDEHLAVLMKPAGLVMHPGAGARRGTLVAGLLARYGSLPGDPARPGLVHRLDRDTTGLVVIAKDATTLRRLAAQVAAREVERSYEALVWGPLREASGVITVPIARSRRDRTRMAPARRGGRSAETTYRVVEPLGIVSRLEIGLGTGRTHQIRVHLRHIGHPVVGDPIYGGRPRSLIGVPVAERGRAKQVLAIMKRQALHAFRLSFTHPVNGERITIEAERPADMAACLEILRQGADR